MGEVGSDFEYRIARCFNMVIVAIESDVWSDSGCQVSVLNKKIEDI
jgi:hypothetical protein